MQKRYLVLILLFVLTILPGCTLRDSDIDFTQAEELIKSEEGADELSSDLQAMEQALADTEEEPDALKAPVTEPSGIFVYVCGAVLRPGVYELSEGSRVNDAVEAAGGFTEDADRNYVNLAAILSDAVKLQIPTVAEVQQGRMPGETFGAETSDTDSGNGLININRASREELTSLPGIGDATAEKIVRYRDEQGGFKSVEDIMNVSGIKEKLFSRIRDLITV